MFLLPLLRSANLRKIIAAIALRFDRSTAKYSAGWIRLIDNQIKIQTHTEFYQPDSCFYVLAEDTQYIDISALGIKKIWFEVTVISRLSLDGHNRSSTYHISASEFKRIDLDNFRKYGLLPLAVEIRCVKVV